MKFSEVIKALEENPSKKFEAFVYGDRYVMELDDCDYFVFRVFTPQGVEVDKLEPRASFNDNVRSTKEWHEVRQSVTWQEALEAWANYKDIYCEIDGDTWTYDRKSEKNGLVATEDENAISGSEILKGKWFIKGENE